MNLFKKLFRNGDSAVSNHNQHHHTLKSQKTQPQNQQPVSCYSANNTIKIKSQPDIK